MTTITLKKQLHKAIDETPDSVFLEAIYLLFKQYNGKNILDYELSAKDKAVLDEQKRMHNEGKTKSYSVAEVRKRAIARLKK